MIVFTNTVKVLQNTMAISAACSFAANVDRMHDEDVWPYSIPKTCTPKTVGVAGGVCLGRSNQPPVSTPAKIEGHG